VKTVAIVHPTSLLGKELRERLERRSDLVAQLRLLSADEDEIGQLTEAAGAAAFVGRLEAGTLEDVDLAFFCAWGEPEVRAASNLPRGALAVVLSEAGTESGLPVAIAGVREDLLAGLDRVASPAAAAVLVASVAAAIAPLGLRRLDGTVLTPVSEYGEAGIDELFEQTRRILAFEGVPRSRVYPTQIAFNLLAAPRDAGAVARAVRLALGDEFPVDLHLVQGGVFHGVAASLRVELARPVALADLRRALGRGRGLTVARDGRRVGPVGVAGDEQVTIGEIRAAEGGQAYWIWAAMDNLVRGGALNAIEAAEALLRAGRPS